VNYLAQHSSAPTERHWNGVLHILKYLKGTADYGLFYPANRKSTELCGYADAGYLNVMGGKSQLGYVMTANGTAISWKSTKSSTVTTSTLHAELMGIFEATKETAWLRSVIDNVQSIIKVSIDPKPTTIFEDNQACINQLKMGFIKTQGTKHIQPKFWYPHEKIENGEIKVEYINSKDNLADLMTKTLPGPQHVEMSKKLGLRSMRELTSMYQRY